MWDDASRLLRYLSESDEGKKTRRIILFSLLGVIFLTLFNRFIVLKFSNSDYFVTRTAMARLLFLNGISPYTPEISSILENYFLTRSAEIISRQVVFLDPIFQLFLFFPFSLIPDFNWSFAVFLTISQVSIILIIELVLRLFSWQADSKMRAILAGTAFFSYLGLTFFTDPDLSAIQLLIFLYGLTLGLQGKSIPAGFLLGLSMLDLPMIVLPVVVVAAYMISTQKNDIVVWMVITIILLTLAGVIFDNTWPLKFTRNIFFESGRFPFRSYSAVVGVSGDGALWPAILNVFPAILVIWGLLEWVRTPKQSHEQLFWLLSFMVCLNPLFTATENFQPSFFFLFTYIFITYLWSVRSEGVVKYYLLGILILGVVILPLAGRLSLSGFSFFNNTTGFNLLVTGVTILMLYWVKWWILQNPLEDAQVYLRE